MRSARYFAADHGVKLPTREVQPSPGDAKVNDEAEAAEGDAQSRSSRDQRVPPDWFLHDDRDLDPGAARQKSDRQGKENRGGRGRQGSEWDESAQSGSGQASARRGGRGGGRSATTAPTVPGRTLPLLPQSSAWHYIDPEGKEQGPFDAKKLLNWVDLGYFGHSDLQVRKTGKEVWVSLSDSLSQIRKEAAGDFSSNHDRAKEPVRGAQVRNDDQPERGRKGPRGGGRAGRARRPDEDDLLPVMPEGRRHPAEALLSPRDEDREEGGQRRYGRRGADHVTPGPEQATRGGRGRGRARGGRSDRREASYSDSRGDHRGDQGGQGAALQSSRGTKPSKPSAKDVAWNLFTAGAKGSEEPVWRYVDPDGVVQGPFTAKEMHLWLESNYLQPELPICGMERKVAPPDLPPIDIYKSLASLLQQVEAGHKFRPVTVQDIVAAQSSAKGQERTSNDGAESVEAKPETAQGAHRGTGETGSNQDAESVTAKDGGSDDDSGTEEGEIAGRTAATDEDSDFDPDGNDSDASVSSPHRPAHPEQPIDAQAAQPASSTASPEKPVSPQKAEGSSFPRQAASPEPTQEEQSYSPRLQALQAAGPAEAVQHEGSQAAASTAPVTEPASPEMPASPERPETHAAETQAAPVLTDQTTGSNTAEASPQRHTSPQKSSGHATSPAPTDGAAFAAATAGPASSAGPASTAGPASAAGPASPAGPLANAQPAQTTNSDVIVEEPEEEQAVAEQEQQADSLDERHESMQIEEVSQQAAPPAQQGKQDTAGSGVVQSVMGAAKSFFGGGKSDEQVGHAHGSTRMVDETLEPNTSRAQASEPTVYEPDTTESEATVDSHSSERGTYDLHEENGSNSGADDIGPAEDAGPTSHTAADVQEGMQNMSIADK